MTRVNRVRPVEFLSVALSLATIFLFIVSPSGTSAQVPTDPDPVLVDLEVLRDWSDEVPAHVSFVEGEAWLERDGVLEASPANVPLLAGDRLRTQGGRVEVLFSDGSVLSLDEQTDAEFLSDTLLRLERGRIRLDLARTGGAAGYRIDAAGTTTWIRTAGEYRLEISDDTTAAPDVRLLVVSGMAELEANSNQTLVRAGYEAFASATTTPSLPHAVVVSRWDGFDRWWDDRRNVRTGYASAEYLPTEVAHYGGVLDREGDWQYEASHGYVWYPRVSSDWAPYSTGRWSYVGTYGWLWVGADRWSWPTHHYGRWGHSRGRYYWIPGRQWAPAWVAWTATPSYVGWVPLGFNNRPLVSIHIGFSSGWRGWTYAPAHGFNARIVVASRGRYLPPRGTRFVERFRGPGRPSVQVRNVRGIRGPARVSRSAVAVPRYGTVQPQQVQSGALGSNRTRAATTDRPAAVAPRRSRAISVPTNRTGAPNRSVAGTAPSRAGTSSSARSSVSPAPARNTGVAPSRAIDGARSRATTEVPQNRNVRPAPAGRVTPPSNRTVGAVPNRSTGGSRVPVPQRVDGAPGRPTSVPPARTTAAPSRSRSVVVPQSTRPVVSGPIRRSAPAAAPRSVRPAQPTGGDVRRPMVRSGASVGRTQPQSRRVETVRPASPQTQRPARSATAAAPSRQPAASRAPQTPRVAPSRPAARQAPQGGRQSAGESRGGGRAAPRDRN